MFLKYGNWSRPMSDCGGGAGPADLVIRLGTRAARLAKFGADVIVDYVNRGVSIAEIATRIDASGLRLGGFSFAVSASDNRPGFPPQGVEKADSAPGIARAAAAAPR
jgi:hypothetical protein